MRAQYEQAAAELLRQARIDALTHDGKSLPADQLATLLADYYRDVVAPLVQKALSDDAAAENALTELISWGRQVEILDFYNQPAVKANADAVLGNVSKIIRNAIDRGYGRCVAHDLTEIVQLIRLAHFSAISAPMAQRMALTRP